jgi:hypothetical protein
VNDAVEIGAVEEALRDHFGDVRILGQVGHGRNSRVYRAQTASQSLAVKQFLRSRTEGRDYLAAEYEALRFLWDAGERRIPEPLMRLDRARLLVFGFVGGERVETTSLRENDLLAMASFLSDLHGYSRESGAQQLPLASEACASRRDLAANIELRLRRLRDQGNARALGGALPAFLDDLRHAKEAACHWSCRTDDRFDDLPGRAGMTLSPSDAGFHNALRCEDGGLVFLDFEHFGWDAPEKMLGDLLLHPAMALTRNQGKRIVNEVGRRIGMVPGLSSRVAAWRPLLALKWCTILLNEFIRGDLVRRSFAGEVANRDTVLSRQLAKARDMFDREVAPTVSLLGGVKPDSGAPRA